ncbi:RNA binding protein, putative [Ricinus communis]|uniref:RNA binding protein, putative n=1 Tax=Ricinus communis TaxID=3988 RepID=B9RPH2_RICCO|nr:RNA binding protein, putative [Ricinus communis]
MGGGRSSRQNSGRNFSIGDLVGRKAEALVQYRNLLSDTDEKKPLTEYVDFSFIRPLPPVPSTIPAFEPLDVVDAFHRDGWWKGIVTKVDVFEDGKTNSKKYTVVFENPPEQFQFLSKDLRFHWDWSNGAWSRPQKQKRMEGLRFSKGMAVEVNLNKENLEDAWFPATVLEEVGFNSFLLDCGSSNGHIKETVDWFHIRPPPPKLDITEFEILEAVDVFHESSWREALIIKILIEGRYSVSLKHAQKEMQLSQSEIRPHLSLMDGYGLILPGNAEDHEVAISVESSIRAMNEIEEKSSCRKLSTAKDYREEKLFCKKSRKNPLKQSMACNAQSPSKKVRKTPPKGEDALSCPSKKLKKANSVKPLSSQACHAELTPIKTINQEMQTNCSTDLRNNVDPSPQDALLENKMTGYMEKRERQMSSKVTSQWVPAVGEQSNIAGNGTSEIDFQDWATEEAELSTVISMEHLGKRERKVENFKQSSVINVPEATELVENLEMPFFKSSLIWKNIESLEVFQVLPQKPHFSPLIRHKEESREGMAMGHMLSFAVLIEKMSKLQVDDGREVFDSYMEVLADLEMHGFQVEAIAECLEKLLSIKDRCKRLEDEAKKVHIGMAEGKHEKIKLEEDIDKIEKRISLLEEQRAMKVSMKMMKDSELITLQVNANAVNEDIVNMEHEFENVATAPW